MPTTINRRMVLLFVAIALAAFAVACGGGDDDPATATARPADPTATPIPATPTPAGIAGDATRGETLFVTETCAGCHSTGENQIVGPGLKGVGARAASLGGDAYLTESIKDPLAVVVEGFAPIMTSFSHLDDQTVADLVAYLKTLN